MDVVGSRKRVFDRARIESVCRWVLAGWLRKGRKGMGELRVEGGGDSGGGL